LQTLRALVAVVEGSDATAVEVRRGSLRIRLRRARPGTTSVYAVAPAASASVADSTSSLRPVRCPITGIWYDAPSPGAPPYVQVGDVLGVGAVVGLVETMKVFNEVTSDAAGIVREVLAHRGDLVQANAVLFTLEPLEGDVAPGHFA
jgi:biotin carboxyl carrier protein